MQKNKNTLTKDYTNNMVETQLVLSINMDIMIAKDDSVRLLSNVLEEIDYSKLMQAYSPLGRKPVVEPKNLFKVLVYAYMNNIYSTRKIEKACKRDINFMWLLEGKKAPDHNTIARFRTGRLQEILDDLFFQFIKKLYEYEEISFKNVFIDGTKLEASANKYTFVWKKSTQKFEKRLQEKILKVIDAINKEFSAEHVASGNKVSVEQLEMILKKLYLKKAEFNIEFVHGKGKRKSKLQRFIEKTEEFIQKQKKYDSYNDTFDGRNSFSKTDKDATFMHMKEDHMKNSQLKPGYNVQIGVEGEYIIGVDISSERSDQLTFIPMMEKLKKNLPEKIENIVADAGYESEENYVYLEKNSQIAYIKPQVYEGMKKKSFKKQIGKRENMIYDELLDEYTCHNNKKLKFVNTKKRKTKSDYESFIKIYECENCEGCELKSKCTRAKGNRQIHVSPLFIEKREASLKNITSEKGIILRINRSIQVEGAFGVLKEDYGFRKFLTRGKKNVNIEILLLCFGYNVNKLHAKIQGDRCGVSLYSKATA